MGEGWWTAPPGPLSQYWENGRTDGARLPGALSASLSMHVDGERLPWEGSAPLVAIVTVNFNGGAFIGEFLASLRAVRYPNVRLYVVDCASVDGSDRLIEEAWPEAVLMRSRENLGFTGGNNLAIQAALADGAPYVLFLNNDTVPALDFLDELMARMEDGRTLAAPRVELHGSGGLLDDTVGVFDWRRGVWRDWLYGRRPPPEWQVERDAPMASLCCLLVPASVFRHAGMLDERLFMYYEDFDFLRRARSAGYRIRFVPAACIQHRRSASSGGGDTPFKVYYATRNRITIMRRHRTLAGFARFSLDFALTRPVRVAQWLARGRADLAGALIRGWWDGYLGRMGRRELPRTSEVASEGPTGQ